MLDLFIYTFAHHLFQEDKSKMRPVDIEADVKEMERRKRVEAIMNSKVSKKYRHIFNFLNLSLCSFAIAQLLLLFLLIATASARFQHLLELKRPLL